jgi:hypothetical protein
VTLRELMDAELDIVGGGAKRAPQPTGLKLVEEIFVDILRFLEPKQRNEWL